MAFDVDGYLREHFADVKTSGKERVSACPVCGRAGKFYASTTEPYGFLCFSGCVKGAGILDMIAAVEQVSRNEAFRRFAKLNRPQRKGTIEDLERDLLAARVADVALAKVDVPLPKEFFACISPRGHRRVPDYLSKKRGVTDEAITHFGIGFCRRGRYFDRIVIPIACPNGRSFTARDMGGKSEMKYMNPKKEDGAEHGRLVLGWPSEPDEWSGREVFVVEGPLDVVRMWQHGFAATCILGKELSLDKMEMLAKLGASGFVVMLDPEEQVAPTDAAERLSALTDNVWIAKLPDGVDPGDSSFEDVRDAHVSAERFKGRRSRELDAALGEASRSLWR